MSEIQLNLKIVYSENTNETFKFRYYFYSDIITFNHLLEYISLFKTKKRICPCYEFYYQNMKISKAERLMELKKMKLFSLILLILLFKLKNVLAMIYLKIFLFQKLKF